jgi:RND family efflux transporter MFP subunit
MRWTILLGLAVLGCEERAEKPASASASRAQATPVLDVVPVEARAIETTSRLPGELTPYEMVAIYPRVSGFVEAISVDRGSKVHSGQVMARLSAPELASQRAEGESKLLADRSTYDRLKAASATPGAVAQHDIEVAEGTLKANEARVKALRALEDYLVVRAPFDGVVTERTVHPGALVGPPTSPNTPPMLRVEQVVRLRLTVAVPESDVGAIAEGAKAKFTVRTWPGQSFEGAISRISRSVDPRTRTMAVELDVDNRAGKLAPGMYAEVLWPIKREKPSLLVPTSAVAQTTEKTFVDRVRDGTVEPVPVQRGISVGNKVEVFGALAPGEPVLVRGSEELRAGASVQTRPWAPDGQAK